MQLNPKNTAVTTVGNGVLLAAALLGTVISRSGPVGAFNDALDSTANIVAAMGFAGSVLVSYINNSTQTGTLVAGDANTTVSGSAAIAANTTAEILLTVTSACLVTAAVLNRSTNV
jgi:hypothetical protein